MRVTSKQCRFESSGHPWITLFAARLSSTESDSNVAVALDAQDFPVKTSRKVATDAIRCNRLFELTEASLGIVGVFIPWDEE